MDLEYLESYFKLKHDLTDARSRNEPYVLKPERVSFFSRALKQEGLQFKLYDDLKTLDASQLGKQKQMWKKLNFDFDNIRAKLPKETKLEDGQTVYELSTEQVSELVEKLESSKFDVKLFQYRKFRKQRFTWKGQHPSSTTEIINLTEKQLRQEEERGVFTEAEAEQR